MNDPTRPHMRAAVLDRYGPPESVQLREVPRPLPGPTEVLVRVHSAALGAGDWHMMRGDPFLMRLMGFGLFRPKHKVLGSDFAGSVAECGSAVEGFEVGDEVFGELSASGFGALAEFVCVDASRVVAKPDNTGHAEIAAAGVSAVTALQALRDVGEVRPGQSVLVVGASGGVGSHAVQLAAHMGAEVSAVCSTRNMGLVRELGAQHVIDYTVEDVCDGRHEFDVIVDCAAFRPIGDYKAALREGGRYVLVGGSTGAFVQASMFGGWMTRGTSKEIRSVLMKSSPEDLRELARLVEVGQLKPTIDREYSFDDVAAALRYVEEGHTQGKVVVAVGGGS